MTLTPTSSQTLVHTFKPRGTAREMLHDRSREVLVSGPAGTGKTRACLEKLNAVALKYPGMRGLIVRQTYRTLSASCVAEFKNFVIDQQLLFGSVKWYGGSGSNPAAFIYANGSTVELAGMDNPAKIMSTQYDFIFVEEATDLTLDGWQALLIRLRNGRMPYQQLLGACNPSHDKHWLKQRCDEGKCLMLHASHEENPRLFDDDGELTPYGHEYIEQGLNQLTGVYYKRYRKGLWVGAEGQIYDEFDPAVHVIDQMPTGWETWPRYWAIDFGFTAPMVVQFWAEDPDGRLYLYRELYHTQTMVEDMARQILNIVTREVGEHGLREWIEPKPQAIICDHDAGGRATLVRHLKFMGTTSAKKAVETGVQLTAMRFRKQKDDKPRIYFLRNALYKVCQALAEAKLPVSTLSELPGYVWGPNEKPVPDNDHGMDAMRYMIAYRDRGGVYNIRRLV